MSKYYQNSTGARLWNDKELSLLYDLLEEAKIEYLLHDWEPNRKWCEFINAFLYGRLHKQERDNRGRVPIYINGKNTNDGIYLSFTKRIDMISELAKVRKMISDNVLGKIEIGKYEL